MKKRYMQTATILMLAAVAARLLGYVRDIVLVAFFGQTALTDAYYAAFTLPDLLYGLVVGGALGPVFIPVFSGYLARQEEQEGWRVANTVLNLVLLLMLGGMVLGFVLAPELIGMLVPGFDEATAVLAVQMTRIMLIQSLLMALSGLAMGVLNSYGQYGPSALGSVMYNLGTVLLGALWAPKWGIAGFAIAVVGGALCYLLVQLPALRRVGWCYQPTLQWRHPGVVKIRQMLGPILLGLSVNQINLVVTQNLASPLGGGMLTALRMAQRIMQLPIGIFAINIAIALFTTMTRQAAAGDEGRYKETFRQGLEAIMLLSLPAAAGMIVLRQPLVNFIYGVGENSQTMVEVTAGLLFIYALSLAAYGSLHLLNRAFYALQDTRTPMLAAAWTVAANIGLSILLRPIWGTYGLAVAYAMAGGFNMVLLLALLHRRIGSFGGRELLINSIKSVLCALGMMVVVSLTAYGVTMSEIGGKLGDLAILLAGGAAGVLSYGIFMRAIGLDHWRKGLRR